METTPRSRWRTFLRAEQPERCPRAKKFGGSRCSRASLTTERHFVHDKSKTLYDNRGQKERMTTPRKSKVITFSLPPQMEEQVRQLMQEEGRTMSELIREALRLYMDEREWLRRQRRQRAEARRSERQEAEGGTDE